MKHGALFYVAVTCLFISCNNTEQVASTTAKPKASRNSEAFNQAIDSLLDPYYALSAAFVEWDSAAVHAQAQQLNQQVEATLSKDAMKELDSSARLAVAKVGSYANSMHPLSLDKSRELFNRLSNELHGFLRVVHYDKQKLYLQQCPMAFNDTGTGIWISKVEEINNPYLGKHHPRYKSGMLHCGETKEALNFSGEAGK